MKQLSNIIKIWSDAFFLILGEQSPQGVGSCSQACSLIAPAWLVTVSGVEYS